MVGRVRLELTITALKEQKLSHICIFINNLPGLSLRDLHNPALPFMTETRKIPAGTSCRSLAHSCQYRAFIAVVVAYDALRLSNFKVAR